MRVLLVEDDLDYINSYIAEIEKDYIVDVAYTASDGAYMSEVNDYDAIIIDSALEFSSNYELCSSARVAHIKSPILYLADKADAALRIECLKNGANVCLNKHITAAELTAQIRALLNLNHQSNACIKNQKYGLELDLNTQTMLINRQQINLRRKEYRILEYLFINRGRVVSKEELLDHVWEDGILMLSNSLEVHVRNIRLKIEKPYGLQIIKTVRGFGYKVE